METKFSSLIADISEYSGRLEKIDCLTSRYSSWGIDEKECFGEFLNYVFRVDYSYGVTFNPTWKWLPDQAQAHLGYEQLLDVFDDLRNRNLSGHAAIAQIELYMVCAANESIFNLGKMILNRTLDCGIDKKTLMKFFPTLLPFTPPMMKCEPAEEKSLKKARYPGMLQLKIDAMRVNADMDGSATDFWTFNGTQFNIESDDLISELNQLRALLAPKYGEHQYLDGELQIYSLGKPLPRKKSNGQANRILKGTAPIEVHENAHIVLWDVIKRDDVVAKKSKEFNLERFTDLKNAIETLNLKYIHLVEHYIVNSEEESYEQVYKWIEAGEEGGVFKNCDAVWEGKRSANCIKFKAERECELRVIGWKPADPDSKYKGMIGSFRCTTDDGGVIVSISGMSDKDRASDPEDWMNGIISALFNEVITSDKYPGKFSLFLPRIIERRFDKDETDTTEVVKAAKGLKKRDE